MKQIKIMKDIVFILEPSIHIEDTTYENCIMKEMNFYKGEIISCNFVHCDLSECNFSKAKIQNCKFVDCYMQFCAMLKVDIYNCEFHECDLWHSNLCHSSIHETLFKNCILKALYKELDWDHNTYDKNTIISSCGGQSCCIDENLIEDLIYQSRRTVDQVI